MKRFLCKVFFFALLIYSIALLPLVFLDKHYGDFVYREKYNYFEKHSTEFNTVFIGSSRTHFQVNPEVVDCVLSDRGVRSFNMGSPSAYQPEVYYLYEEVLENDESRALQYAIVELQYFNRHVRERGNVQRIYYWLNVGYVKYAIEYVWSVRNVESDYVRLSIAYLSAYVNKVYYLWRDLRVELSEGNKDRSYLVGDEKNGFYSMNDKMRDTGAERSPLYRMNKEYIDNPDVVEDYVSKTTGVYRMNSSKYIESTRHLKEIQNLIRKSKEKGICVFFVIPPMMGPSSYRELLWLEEQLGDEYVVNMGDPSKFPGFYSIENGFHYGHLNESGAKLYSELLAKELLMRIKNMENNANLREAIR